MRKVKLTCKRDPAPYRTESPFFKEHMRKNGIWDVAEARGTNIFVRSDDDDTGFWKISIFGWDYEYLDEWCESAICSDMLPKELFEI